MLAIRGLGRAVMSTDLIVATIGAIALLITSAFTVIYGPAWKDRSDLRRAQATRSEHLLSRYSEPLARAAFDLQSRLYNILRLDFLQGYYKRRDYAEISTLWLIGQFLAWNEILRREVQVLNVGDSRRTAQLQGRLFEIVDTFASDSRSIIDQRFGIFKHDQRAIGEIMVVSREVDQVKRSDCMGYAQFAEMLRRDEFGHWFWSLRRDLQSLAEAADRHHGYLHCDRLILIQRALIDLVDFLDEKRTRFPILNDRGKIPLPMAMRAGKEPTSRYSVAKFVYEEGNLWHVFDAWVKDNSLTANSLHSSGTRSIRCASRNMSVLCPRLVVKISCSVASRPPYTVEIEAHAEVVNLLRPADMHDANEIPNAIRVQDNSNWFINLWTRRAREIVNDLLCRFDRPLVR